MDKAYIQALMAGAKPPSQASKYKYVNGQFIDPNPPKPKKQSGKGGFLTSLISEGGAAGGAAAGAGIGTALLPGVGTAIGAGLGGLFGGFSGRLTENKIRDNEFRPGQALGEGLISGALSAVGPGFQALKGAKGAKGLSGAIGAVDDVARTSKGLPSTALIGATEKKGLGMTSKAGGYFVGATRPGASPLSPSQVQKYDKLLRKLKVPANDASDMLFTIEPVQKQLYKQLDDAVSKSTAVIDGKKLGRSLVAEVQAKQGLGATELKIAREQAAKFSKKMSPSEVLKAKRELDNAISYVANPDAATSSKQAVAEIFRKGFKTELDNATPGLKNINSTAHDLAEISSFASRAANRVGNEATSSGGGLVGRALSSPLANTMRAKSGVAVQGVGRALAGTGGPATAISRYAKLQAPANLMGAAMGASAEQAPAEPLAETPVSGDMTADPMAGTSQFDPQMMEQEMPQQSAYSLEQAIADIQAAPDAKSQKAIMDYYKFISGAEADMSKSTGQELTAIQRNKIAGYQTANEVVNQLEQLWQNVGQPQSQLAAGLGGFPGVKQARSSFDPNTRQYTQFAEGTLAPIIKSLGESGVLTDKDIIRAYGLVPNLQDSQQVATNKIQQLKMLLANAQTATSGTAGGEDTSQLYEALLTSGGL